MLLIKLLPLVSPFISRAWAQSEMAQCVAGFEWNLNSLGQDPCTVGSMLDALCRGLAVYTYSPLNHSQYYLPPRKDHSGDLTCDCNTVMYNLYMACASCQKSSIYSWKKWIAACENISVSQYLGDIPHGTAVPHWAFFNVTLSVNQTYDQATMISTGRDPEESPIPISTLVGSSGSSSSQPGPTGSSSGTGGNTKSGTNVGAIVGGVVGSIVPLTILATAAFFYMRYRRRQQQVQNTGGLNPFGRRPTSGYEPLMNSVPFTPYNPSDPSTFPPQGPPGLLTYTAPSYNNNARGAYPGVPEV